LSASDTNHDVFGPDGRCAISASFQLAATVSVCSPGVVTLNCALCNRRYSPSRMHRTPYAPAHLRYERIEPIAELFNDLDRSMDSREDDFDKKAAKHLAMVVQTFFRSVTLVEG
jgi:hypothetical protein